MCTIGRICNWCTGCVAMVTLLKCLTEPSGNPPGPTACHTHATACRTRTLRMPVKTALACVEIDAPAVCAIPFRPYCRGVVMRMRNLSEYMLVLALYLVCFTPLPSNRHHRSSGDCLEGKGGNYQVCSVQYCVQQLCTVRCTHI